MAKIYYRWIKADKMTIDEVPTKWKAAVQEMLLKDAQDLLNKAGLIN